MDYIKDRLARFAIWLLWSLAIVALAGCSGAYDGAEPAPDQVTADASAPVDCVPYPVTDAGLREEAQKCGPTPERRKDSGQ